MSTEKDITRLCALAIAIGVAVMAFSTRIAAASELAGIVSFVVGFGVAGVGCLKFLQLAKAGS